MSLNRTEHGILTFFASNFEYSWAAPKAVKALTDMLLEKQLLTLFFLDGGSPFFILAHL